MLRALRTGRVKPFKDVITLKGDAAALFKPVRGLTMRGWKGLGGQYYTEAVGAFNFNTGAILQAPTRGASMWIKGATVGNTLMDAVAVGVGSYYLYNWMND